MSSSPPMTARLAGLLERANEKCPVPLCLRRSAGTREIRDSILARDDWAELVHQAEREILALAPALLARIAALESVSLASMPFRVEAVAHLEAQERYREHRHGEPDTTEKMLRAALNVIRDMDNAARAALTHKENDDVG